MLWLLFGLEVILSPVQAITLALLPNTIAQCETLPIHWFLSQEEQVRAPFNITILPFMSQPFNLTVTPSPFRSEDAGIFAQALPLASGTSFIVAAGGGAQNTT